MPVVISRPMRKRIVLHVTDSDYCHSNVDRYLCFCRTASELHSNRLLLCLVIPLTITSQPMLSKSCNFGGRFLHLVTHQRTYNYFQGLINRSANCATACIMGPVVGAPRPASYFFALIIRKVK